MIWDVLIDRKGVNRIQTELLLRKAQSGDTGALDTLITAYYPQILNYCRWHTADEQQAQDAAQETFLKAVRWLDSCGGFQGTFRPFLYKIAKNICIDLNRTHGADGGIAGRACRANPPIRKAALLRQRRKQICER
ncbi:MAG: RNA polymerase sigma factor [Faecalibacterium sp.]